MLRRGKREHARRARLALVACGDCVRWAWPYRFAAVTIRRFGSSGGSSPLSAQLSIEMSEYSGGSNDPDLNEGLFLEMTGSVRSAADEHASAGMAGGATAQWNSCLRTQAHDDGHGGVSKHESLDYDQIYNDLSKGTRQRAGETQVLRLLGCFRGALGAHRCVRAADRHYRVLHEQGHRKYHTLEDGAADGAAEGRSDD